ncbi:MAG: short-chain dehydrogenase, partial [Candidatus Kapabacteria bacterium]|nr:short-chain dehydrogenase [Candidatus Kapabacteria bacterium]
TVKPGFVNTAMTAKLKKNFLFAEPETIAAGILKAVDNNKDVVYLPFFWKYIMMIIKNIPESIFKKLKL